MIEAFPVIIVWAPRIMAFREEAQTLFMVVAIVELGRPALRAHWRAGFWPRLEEGQRVERKEEGWLGGKRKRDRLGIGCVLCGEHIAKEDFLNIFWFQALSTLESSYLGVSSGRIMSRSSSEPLIA
jgi:hypothetical protein